MTLRNRSQRLTTGLQPAEALDASARRLVTGTNGVYSSTYWTDMHRGRFSTRTFDLFAAKRPPARSQYTFRKRRYCCNNWDSSVTEDLGRETYRGSWWGSSGRSSPCGRSPGWREGLARYSAGSSVRTPWLDWPSPFWFDLPLLAQWTVGGSLSSTSAPAK